MKQLILDMTQKQYAVTPRVDTFAVQPKGVTEVQWPASGAESSSSSRLLPSQGSSLWAEAPCQQRVCSELPRCCFPAA